MSRVRTVLGRRWYLAAAAGLALAAIAVFVLSRVASSRRDETWTRIQREGSMRVGMDASYPPFNLVDSNGSFTGYDVDLVVALGSRLGVRVEFADISFDGLYDALLSGRIDLIASALPYDRLLTRDVAYSHSYFDAGQMLIVRQGDDHVKGIADLAGLRVAVELGSAAHQEARRLDQREGLGFSLVLRSTPEEVIHSLIEGQADAAIYDGIAARQMVGQGNPIELIDTPLTDEPYVIAVRLDSPTLLERVNDALVGLREEGFFERVEAKWF